MSSLATETVSRWPLSAKWKKLWNGAVAAVLCLIIVAFLYIVVSNMYLLYTGHPMLNMGH